MLDVENYLGGCAAVHVAGSAAVLRQHQGGAVQGQESSVYREEGLTLGLEVLHCCVDLQQSCAGLRCI